MRQRFRPIKRPKIERASETDIAFGVLVVAAFQPDGVASYHRLKIEIPIHIRLSSFDVSQSVTHENEEMWVQQLRNIKAHANRPGNFIYEGYVVHIPRVGYRVTPAGFRRRMQGRDGR
jgi:hypothetical protein